MSWLHTRSWQTILPTISTHANKATRPTVVAEKAKWTDTRPSIWAEKATERERARWNEMQKTDRTEAATSDEEDWTYISEGAQAEGLYEEIIPEENTEPRFEDLQHKDMNQQGMLAQVLFAEHKGSADCQEVVTKVLQRLDWKGQEINAVIKSWKKEGMLDIARKNKSTVWVKHDDKWVAAPF